MPICVADDILEWAKSDLFNQHHSWSKASALLNKNFQTPGLDAHLRRELYTSAIHPTETILEYGYRFRSLMRRLNIPDNWDIACFFVEQLPARIQDAILLARMQY